MLSEGPEDPVPVEWHVLFGAPGAEELATKLPTGGSAVGGWQLALEVSGGALIRQEIGRPDLMKRAGCTLASAATQFESRRSIQELSLSTEPGAELRGRRDQNS